MNLRNSVILVLLLFLALLFSTSSLANAEVVELALDQNSNQMQALDMDSVVAYEGYAHPGQKELSFYLWGTFFSSDVDTLALLDPVTGEDVVASWHINGSGSTWGYAYRRFAVTIKDGYNGGNGLIDGQVYDVRATRGTEAAQTLVRTVTQPIIDSFSPASISTHVDTAVLMFRSDDAAAIFTADHQFQIVNQNSEVIYQEIAKLSEPHGNYLIFTLIDRDKLNASTDLLIQPVVAGSVYFSMNGSYGLYQTSNEVILAIDRNTLYQSRDNASNPNYDFYAYGYNLPTGEYLANLVNIDTGAVVANMAGTVTSIGYLDQWAYHLPKTQVPNGKYRIEFERGSWGTYELTANVPQLNEGYVHPGLRDVTFYLWGDFLQSDVDTFAVLDPDTGENLVASWTRRSSGSRSGNYYRQYSVTFSAAYNGGNGLINSLVYDLVVTRGGDTAQTSLRTITQPIIDTYFPSQISTSNDTAIIQLQSQLMDLSLIFDDNIQFQIVNENNEVVYQETEKRSETHGNYLVFNLLDRNKLNASDQLYLQPVVAGSAFFSIGENPELHRTDSGLFLLFGRTTLEQSNEDPANPYYDFIFIGYNLAGSAYTARLFNVDTNNYVANMPGVITSEGLFDRWEYHLDKSWVPNGRYKIVFENYGSWGTYTLDSNTQELGMVQSSITMDYNNEPAGVSVYLFDQFQNLITTTSTNSSGQFAFYAPPGTYSIKTAKLPGYLRGKTDNVVINNNAPTVIDPLRMAFGDINGDGVVNVLDLVMLSRNIGLSD